MYVKYILVWISALNATEFDTGEHGKSFTSETAQKRRSQHWNFIWLYKERQWWQYKKHDFLQRVSVFYFSSPWFLSKSLNTSSIIQFHIKKKKKKKAYPLTSGKGEGVAKHWAVTVCSLIKSHQSDFVLLFPSLPEARELMARTPIFCSSGTYSFTALFPACSPRHVAGCAL